MGDTPSGVVARRACPSDVASFGRVTHAPADPRALCEAIRRLSLHQSTGGCGGGGGGGRGRFRAGWGGAGGVWCSSSTWDGDEDVEVPRFSSSTELWTVLLCRDVCSQCKLRRRRWISPRCRSWTRLLTARCCAVLVMVQTVQLCAVLDKAVDFPVVVQVQGMAQTAHSSCSSWTRSLTCLLLCSDKPSWFSLRRGADRGIVPEIMEKNMRYLRGSSSWTKLLPRPLLYNGRCLGFD